MLTSQSVLLTKNPVFRILYARHYLSSGSKNLLVQSHIYGDGSSMTLEVAKKTEQIVEILRVMKNHQLLVIVIKRILDLDFLPQSAKATGISPVSLASVRKRCERMCKCLLEKILQSFAVCFVDPTLCTPASDPSQFVVTLQPYLKIQVVPVSFWCLEQLSMVSWLMFICDFSTALSTSSRK